MRLLPIVLLLAACSPETPDKAPERALYAGEGRDRLCIAGERVGFITYGQGDANCSLRGRLNRAGEQLLAIIPDGDQDCRITAQEQGETIRLGRVNAACAYYCGPGSSFGGKRFNRSPSVSPAVDFAGDPLC